MKILHTLIAILATLALGGCQTSEQFRTQLLAEVKPLAKQAAYETSTEIRDAALATVDARIDASLQKTETLLAANADLTVREFVAQHGQTIKDDIQREKAAAVSEIDAKRVQVIDLNVEKLAGALAKADDATGKPTPAELAAGGAKVAKAAVEGFTVGGPTAAAGGAVVALLASIGTWFWNRRKAKPPAETAVT